MTTVFLVLLAAALFLVLTTPFARRRVPAADFDPGVLPGPAPIAAATTREPDSPSRAVDLGDGVLWAPEAHPNPHLLIVGGSGSGKSWTVRLLARRLLGLGYDCVLFDFHGDLGVEGATSHPVSLDSRYGVNPLAVAPDPTGGGPDPQRIEVLERLRNTFKPMGSLQLALLDDCLKAVYRRFGLRQEDPASWNPPRTPHLGDLEAEIDRRIAEDPGNQRARALRTKLSAAFDFRIFSKPGVPVDGEDADGGTEGGERACGTEDADTREGIETEEEATSDHARPKRACADRQNSAGTAESTIGITGKGVRVDLSKLPPPLQYLAADTLLDRIFRRRRLEGPQPLSLFLLVDESKLCTPARRDSPMAALNRLATEGRKFGVGLIAASQFVGHLPRDVVVNTFTKIVMRTDPTEIAPTARRFRIDETRLEALRRPGDALVHFADRTDWISLRVAPEEASAPAARAEAAETRTAAKEGRPAERGERE
jgi:hypothetical protein